MDTLWQELERRHTRAREKGGYDFLYAVCDYMDLLDKNKTLQNIMLSEKENTDADVSVWKNYQLLYTDVYEPVRYKPDQAKRWYWNFKLLSRDIPLLFLLINPLSFWALIDRKKYRDQMTKVHERVLLLLKNQEYIELKEQTPIPAVVLGLPIVTDWEKVKISFLNSHEVHIFVDNTSIKTDLTAMGFADKRKRKTEAAKPRRSWQLLYLLSTQNGVLDTNKHGTPQKAKEELAAFLQTFFGLTEDPFHKWSTETHEYAIKIKLVPEQTFRDDFRDRDIFTDEEPDEIS